MKEISYKDTLFGTHWLVNTCNCPQHNIHLVKCPMKMDQCVSDKAYFIKLVSNTIYKITDRVQENCCLYNSIYIPGRNHTNFINHQAVNFLQYFTNMCFVTCMWKNRMASLLIKMDVTSRLIMMERKQ